MKYAIGLDVGIASVGYALLELDANDNPCRIIRLGSRVFEKAEMPKTGESLALARREARSMRRRLRRHRHRLERIRNLIVQENILTEEDLDVLFDGRLSDIYEIRCKGLDTLLSPEEFSRVMIHLAQRRGFRSNRRDGKSDEDGKLLSAVSENAQLMQENGYRTVGELFARHEKFAVRKRNESEEYTNTVSRDLIEDEARQIFSAQRALGNAAAREAVEEKYLSILLSQRSFDEGPGGDSPYGGNQIENKIGLCTFENETFGRENQRRAPKSSYAFGLFSLWQNVNHIRIVSADGTSRLLTEDQRKSIVETAHKNANLDYGKLRKLLHLSETERFNISYGDKSVKEVESKKKFNFLKGYHSIKKVLEKIGPDHIDAIEQEVLEQIAYLFTIYRTDDKISAALDLLGLTAEEKQALATLSPFSGFGHLSVLACNQLIPHLKNGLTYDKACAAAGYQFQGHRDDEKTMFLSSDLVSEIVNPVVKRAVSQTIKVLNALIREQGESPVYLNIELAREMAKDFRERREIEKSQKENESKNEAIKKKLQELYGLENPKGYDIVKLKLWEQQDGISPYSQKAIPIQRLFEPGFAEVDHIIPYSISFDDSYNNKVLVFASENREKRNRLPLQYLKGEAADRFTVWVQNNVKSYKKRLNLLKREITEEDTARFLERNLQDTKYTSRLLYNYIKDNLLFSEYSTKPEQDGKRRRHVFSVNGAMTAFARRRWGVEKVREDGDLHHAMDAVVIACVNQSMINRVSRYYSRQETQYALVQGDADYMVDRNTGEVIDRFPQPWPSFRDELLARLGGNPAEEIKRMNLQNYAGVNLDAIKPSFVSRAPSRKVSGEVHEATVRAMDREKNGYVVTKTALTDLKWDAKTESIEGYVDPDSDRLLYAALCARLKECDGDAKVAFGGETPFRKPTSDGREGPLVKKVKIRKKSSLAVPVQQETAVARNSKLVRTDVFYVEDEGYYFVPIYVADTLKKTLPSRACVQGNKEWPEMREEHFVFSLYPNDLIRVYSKKGLPLSLNLKSKKLPEKIVRNDCFLYYSGLDISAAVLNATTHDNTYKVRSIGKTVSLIEKYQVDVLGNVTKVKREKRQSF